MVKNAKKWVKMKHDFWKKIKMKRIFNEDSIFVPIGSQDTYQDRGPDMGSIWGYTGVLQARNCPKWGKTSVFWPFYVTKSVALGD